MRFVFGGPGTSSVAGLEVGSVVGTGRKELIVMVDMEHDCDCDVPPSIWHAPCLVPDIIPFIVPPAHKGLLKVRTST